jgi:hypothetical protein
MENMEKNVTNFDIKDLLINEKNISLLDKKENTSFNIKKLLKTDVDQSQSIRFGNLFQNWIKDVIRLSGGEIIDIQFIDVYETGNTKTNKGLKDMDILFSLNNKMFYYEAKTNLDLDSEKCKETDRKINDISNHLIKNYNNKEIHSGVLSCWYEKEVGLSVKVKTNVVYIKDLFEILNINCTKEEYYQIMEEFGNEVNKKEAV